MALSNNKKKKLKELLEKKAKASGVWSFKVKFEENKEKLLKLKMECMYEFNEFLSYALLKEIAELLGTDKTDVGEEMKVRDGCDTCDYGSLSTLTLVVRDYNV